MATKKKPASSAKKSGRPTLGSSHKRPASSAPKGRSRSDERPSREGGERTERKPTRGARGPARKGPARDARGERGERAERGEREERPRGRADKAGARTPTKKSAAAARRAVETSLRPPKKAAARGKAPLPEPSRKVQRPPRAPGETASADVLALAEAAARAASDKKAVDVCGYDVAGRVDYADVLLLMSGRSDRHVAAIADAIEEALATSDKKRRPLTVEGRPQATWIVLDYGDLVAHVFQEEARSHYDLDGIWTDARKLPFEL